MRFYPHSFTKTLNWKDEYSLGIQEIDDQHKLLLHAFSAVEDTIKQDKGWSSIHFSIVELKALARMHFSFEEALMRLFGFQDIKEHSSEHEHFFVKLEEIENHSLRNSLGAEILEFLHEWLTKHIRGIDNNYAPYILSGASVVRSDASRLKQSPAA